MTAPAERPREFVTVTVPLDCEGRVAHLAIPVPMRPADLLRLTGYVDVLLRGLLDDLEAHPRPSEVPDVG